jgi:hypothetical protein
MKAKLAHSSYHSTTACKPLTPLTIDIDTKHIGIGGVVLENKLILLEPKPHESQDISLESA